MSTKWTVTIDCAHPSALAAFGVWRWDTSKVRRRRVSEAGYPLRRVASSGANRT
jgi:hypothetical protein